MNEKRAAQRAYQAQNKINANNGKTTFIAGLLRLQEKWTEEYPDDIAGLKDLKKLYNKVSCEGLSDAARKVLLELEKQFEEKKQQN